jgi:hypothetical protein
MLVHHVESGKKKILGAEISFHFAPPNEKMVNVMWLANYLTRVGTDFFSEGCCYRVVPNNCLLLRSIS